MLNEELLQTIACLEIDYPAIYKTLSTLDQYPRDKEKNREIHLVLRERLFEQMSQFGAGTPTANAIHCALRALARQHPCNTECPIAMEPINFNDIDNYLAMSTGHIILKTVAYVQHLKKSEKNWVNPLTGLEYSPYDVDYIETFLGIKKSEPIKAAVLTPFGAVVITLNDEVMYLREDGLEPYPEQLVQTFLMRVLLGVYPVFETLEDLRIFEREAPRLHAALRQAPAAIAQHSTRHSFLSSFRRHIQPNVNVDGTQRRRPCVLL